jgi:hypothetical protein
MQACRVSTRFNEEETGGGFNAVFVLAKAEVYRLFDC